MATEQHRPLPAQPSDISGAFVRVEGDPGDWPGLLLRLYLRWAERAGLKVTWVDGQPDRHPAGHASGILLIEGPTAFEQLGDETGIHGLATEGRQSFATVEVLPYIEKPTIPKDEFRMEEIPLGELRVLS